MSNIRSKYNYYKAELKDGPSGEILIQRDEISVDTLERGIEFPLPYKNPPKVEIVNVAGYDKNFLPSIKDAGKDVSPFHANLSRQYSDPVRCVWIASGEPLTVLTCGK
ncbi:MAG: hypothetical protein HQK56_15275 [Deltaproteobacteria bacterium]|nr:hypothetical protein [Deltaproteobacteria bacterium]